MPRAMFSRMPETSRSADWTISSTFPPTRSRTRWLALAKGATAFTVEVTPDLAPGFSAVFSYIRAGVYRSEVFSIPVNNSGRLLKLTVTPDQASYIKGQTAHLAIVVADSSEAPVAATLLADGYDARISAYK